MSIRKSIELELSKLGAQHGLWVTSMEVDARIWDHLMEELDEAEGTYVLDPGGFVMLEFDGRHVHVSKRGHIPKHRIVTYDRTYDPPA